MSGNALPLKRQRREILYQTMSLLCVGTVSLMRQKLTMRSTPNFSRHITAIPTEYGLHSFDFMIESSSGKPQRALTAKSRTLMSGELKAKAQGLIVGKKYGLLRQLIVDGFFDSPISSEDIVLRIGEQFGKRWKTSYVHPYMQPFMHAGIIQAIKLRGHKGNYWVLASVKRDHAIRGIGKSKRVREIEEELFSPALQKLLEKEFGRELDELNANFGKHGNCTAFLLRKILEKLIIIAFAKRGKAKLLEDPARPGGWIGLQKMINIAAKEKLDGIPFLIGKTALEIKGIKFLGDTAAHNPLANVDMNTILPQMAYIITAYEELAKRL